MEFEIMTTLYGAYNLQAAIAVLAWDIIETLPDEVTHIWGKKIGFITLMYVITRYGPFLVNVVFAALINQISVRGMFVDVTTLYYLYCLPWFVVLGCTESLFIMRAVALNGNSRWLSRILISLFAVEMVSALISFFMLLRLEEVVTFSKPIFLPLAGPRVFVIFTKSASGIPFAIPQLVFQFILVSIIITTLIRNRKAWTCESQSNLVSIVIRDGLWGYFFNLFGLMVVFWSPIGLSGPAGQPELQWSYVTFSVTSTRLLLNLRSGSESTYLDDFTLSAILIKSRNQVSPTLRETEGDCEPQELELSGRIEGTPGTNP